jgi:hypothetical protein
MTNYSIRTYATGINYAHYARIRQGGKLVHETSLRPSSSSARQAAERWVEDRTARKEA